MKIRIGQGWDIHRLVQGKPLRLGGVTVPFDRGPLAHSDGDVVFHALCDALLGAAAAGDIGTHFPDSDPEYRDADSRFFVSRAVEILEEKGLRTGNVDVTIFAERPRLSGHVSGMRRAIASILRVDDDCVNVKAKTMEKLDAVGRGEAIAASVVVLVYAADESTG